MFTTKGGYIQTTKPVGGSVSGSYSQLAEETSYELDNLDTQYSPDHGQSHRDAAQPKAAVTRRVALTSLAVWTVWHGLIITVAALGYVGNYAQNSMDGSQITGSCLPNGNFYAGVAPQSPWSVTGIFEIDLAFGALSFSNAKLADIVWDVVIGRGGQAVLAYIAYQVATKVLARNMELAPVTYNTFIAITLRPSSLGGSHMLLKDYLRNTGIRAKLSIIWILLTFGYVLTFPTLISAMTGYTPNLTPYIALPTGELISWQDFRQVYYVIHDGPRIGLNESFVVSNIPLHDSYDLTIDNLACDVNGPSGVTPGCGMQWDTLSYLYESVFKSDEIWENATWRNHSSAFAFQYGTNSTPTVFNLSAPLLDISIHMTDFNDYLWWLERLLIYNSTYYNLTSYNSTEYARLSRYAERLPVNFQSLRFSYQNQAFDIDYLNQKGICQPENSFAWGYSFLLLFIVVLVLLVWTTALVSVWIDAYLNSLVDRTGHRLDLRSAAVELTDALDPESRKILSAEYQTGFIMDKDAQEKLDRVMANPAMEYKMHSLTTPTKMTRRDALKCWVLRRARGQVLWRWRYWLLGLAVALDFALTGYAVALVTRLAYSD